METNENNTVIRLKEGIQYNVYLTKNELNALMSYENLVWYILFIDNKKIAIKISEIISVETTTNK